MIKKLFFTAIILLLILSCRKDESTCKKNYFTIHPELAPYLFDVGSYWIYKDSTSSLTDSSSVLSAGIYKRYSPGGPSDDCPDEIQYFAISYYNFTTQANDIENIELQYISRNYKTIYRIDTAYFNTPKLIATFSSLQVENTIYNNVKEFQVARPDGYINYYSANFVGIIKQTSKINGLITTSNLLRHKAVMWQ